MADGAFMRDWLAAQQKPATWVWSSPAARALATASYVAEGFSAHGCAAPLAEDPDLYLASAETLLGCLASTPGEHASVAIVAHNPGITHLLNALCERPVTDNAVTFACAQLDFPATGWTDLRFGGAQLVAYDVPRQLRS